MLEVPRCVLLGGLRCRALHTGVGQTAVSSEVQLLPLTYALFCG